MDGAQREVSIDRKQRPGALLKEYNVEKAKVQHKNSERYSSGRIFKRGVS